MTGSANPTEAREDGGLLAPRPGGKPVAHCFRCGVEIPVGEGLCDEHNPNALKGPSSTQMHATVFGGVVLGVIVLFLLARLAVGTTGPYAAEVIASSAGPDGNVVLSYSVTNEGDSDGVADCRVTRDGVPRPDDLAFRSGVVAAGETITLERTLLPPPQGSVGYDADALSVVCS